MPDLKLSPKHGLNPTIPVCFWCGEERNEVALMGRIGDRRKHEDFEAPMHMVIDYEPCDSCRMKMSQGFTVMEATQCPNSVARVPMQEGVYPTGRWAVLKPETAKRIFQDVDLSRGKAFMDTEAFSLLFDLQPCE